MLGRLPLLLPLLFASALTTPPFHILILDITLTNHSDEHLSAPGAHCAEVTFDDRIARIQSPAMLGLEDEPALVIVVSHTRGIWSYIGNEPEIHGWSWLIDPQSAYLPPPGLITGTPDAPDVGGVTGLPLSWAGPAKGTDLTVEMTLREGPYGIAFIEPGGPCD